MLTLLLLLIDGSNRMMIVLHQPKYSYEYQFMHLYMQYLFIVTVRH